jgi:hypothetical protein
MIKAKIKYPRTGIKELGEKKLIIARTAAAITGSFSIDLLNVRDITTAAVSVAANIHKLINLKTRSPGLYKSAPNERDIPRQETAASRYTPGLMVGALNVI